jgi:tetratricopeptide (TPR) repeat protein
MTPTRNRRVLFFVFAILLAATTTIFIGLSVGAIRDSVHFSRLMRRIEFGETDPTTLLEAAEFARRPAEWERLIRFAWDLPSDGQWSSVRDIALLARERFPRDPRWHYAAAYAMIRLGEHADAREFLSREDLPRDDETGQLLVLLTIAVPEEGEAAKSRLASLADAGDDSLSILEAVGRAERDGTPEALIAAWEETEVSAYAVNGALEAAAVGDRTTATAAVESMRAAGSVPSAERFDAPLILALWLDEVDWLFSQLRTLPRSRAFQPTVLLIQAEGHLLQGRLEEARRFYRELQTVDPGYSDLAFQNDAAITLVRDDGDVPEIYRRALRYHPRSLLLRGEYAGLLTARDERLAAVQVIAPAAVDAAGFSGNHRDWLLLRAVLGARTPLSRLESDLWQYLNEHGEAEIVARYLARFVSRRNDADGVDRLLRRYPPEEGEWAATLHLTASTRRGDLPTAERILDATPPESWTAWANRAIFSLRHLPLNEAAEAIDGLDRFLSRGPSLPPAELTEGQVTLALLRGEHARLSGNAQRAREFADRALSLAAEDPAIQVYRALLAPPQ